MGAARRVAGPAVPGRGRARARAAVRHRAGRAARRAPARRARARSSSSCSGSRWRRATGPPTGRAARCPSRLARLRRPRRRGARRAARRPRRAAREQGKLDWPAEEFEAMRTRDRPRRGAGPWRRTSGIHKIRKPRGLARCVRCGRPVTGSPPSATSPRAASFPRGDRRRGGRRAHVGRGTGGAAGVPRPVAAPADRATGTRPWREAARLEPTSCRGARDPGRGAPAGGALGGP